MLAPDTARPPEPPGALAVVCPLHGPDLREPPEGPYLWARVQSASGQGVDLLVSRPFRPGQRSGVQVRPAAEPDHAVRLARVAGVEAVRPGAWLVRCEFVA
jgi:hypothetical protein